jgi:hypothetical protein
VADRPVAERTMPKAPTPREKDASEKIVSEHLAHRGFRDVVFEPDGNVPPDFLADGRIAVEVRRLNQNVETPAGPRGLEQEEFPLRAMVEGLLPTLGPATGDESWFVYYSLRRPLPQWKQLEVALRQELAAFRNDPERRPPRRGAVPGLRRIDLIRAGDSYPDFFGGSSDSDSGGFVLSEQIRNIRICVAEKTRKMAPVRHKYPEWWLALVDRIGFGNTSSDVERLRQLLELNHSWDKIILINPLDATEGHEL